MIRIILFAGFVFLVSQFSEARDFKGAEYRTINTFLYGRFEVRYKSPAKEGVLASFFTYREITNTSQWNEIDIEILGRYENQVQFNTITPGQVNHVRSHYVDFNPHTSFNVYAFEWTPEYVAWFINDTEVYRQTGSWIQTLSNPQKLMMNIWNPVYENWVGEWDPEVLPAFAYYDWVKYYQYTPGSGNYGTNNNFTHSWTDEFDFFDTSRWQKATHTFPGNNCDFIPQNVVFKDGMMILCLTDNVNLGYTDVTPPKAKWARKELNGKITVMFSEELDEVSAQTASNFVIPNVTVNSSVLRDDLKSVDLTVTGYQPGQSYNVVVMNIKDKAPVPNTAPPRALSIIDLAPLNFPLGINVGGSTAHGFLADREFKPNSSFGYMDGTSSQYPNSIQIHNTDLDSVYRADRYHIVAYKIRVPNGLYNVKLMFAENYFNSAGSRVFDIYVEGNLVRDNLDIYASAGKHTAYDVQLQNISVSDMLLEIYIAAEIDNGQLNGIYLEQLTSDVQNDQGTLPEDFRLEQNYPNPFNGTTKIRFYLPESDSPVLKIYDLLGSEVLSFNLGPRDSGENLFTLSAGKVLSSGVYFYSLIGRDYSDTKKLVILN